MPRGWKLWYGPTTPESVREAISCGFYRIGADTTMCYAKANNICRLQAAKEDFLREMSAEDQRWLKECIDAVLIQKTARERKTIESNNRAFLQRFAEELKIEKSKLLGTEVSSDGKRSEEPKR